MAKIRELIEQAGGTAEEAVVAAKNRYLDQVRGVLRDLTRLKFTDRQGVMAHELAHAYTHVGLDSNSNRWEDGECDKGIVEGLAQFYTHKTAEALRDERGHDRVWIAHARLTDLQKANGATAYVNHLDWVKTISPEAMRQGLLDLRRGHIKREFEPFCEALNYLARRYPMKGERSL